MKQEHELLVKGDEVFLLTEDTKTISLAEAISTLAMCTYAEMTKIKNADELEKEDLKEKIYFQSRVLDSLSGAYSAIKR